MILSCSLLTTLLIHLKGSLWDTLSAGDFHTEQTLAQISDLWSSHPLGCMGLPGNSEGGGKVWPCWWMNEGCKARRGDIRMMTHEPGLQKNIIRILQHASEFATSALIASCCSEDLGCFGSLYWVSISVWLGLKTWSNGSQTTGNMLTLLCV
jgi:hypothetical protein